MFGSIDKSKGLLFVTHDLDHSLRSTIQKMRQEVEMLDENRLLNTAPDDLKRYLIEKYSVTPITLLRDQWYADHKDAPVDVRHDRMRWIDDRSRPAMVPGERVEVRIPFEGELELFYAKANTFTMNPPSAVIERNELVLRYESPADQPQDIRPLVDRALADIEQYPEWQRGMIDAHNSSSAGCGRTRDPATARAAAGAVTTRRGPRHTRQTTRRCTDDLRGANGPQEGRAVATTGKRGAVCAGACLGDGAVRAGAQDHAGGRWQR